MPYLKTVLCRMVSIVDVMRKKPQEGEEKLLLHFLPENVADEEDRDETEILSRFLTGIGQSKPQIVGFNSQSADLKIFVQRAIVKGISAPDFCKPTNKPWDGRTTLRREAIGISI